LKLWRKECFGFPSRDDFSASAADINHEQWFPPRKTGSLVTPAKDPIRFLISPK